jgi:hypothetical protein
MSYAIVTTVGALISAVLGLTADHWVGYIRDRVRRRGG